MALTCLRAQQIYEFLKTSTSDEFLANWRAIFGELQEPLNSTLGDIKKPSKTTEIEPVPSPLVVKSAYLVLDEFLHVSAQFPNVSKQFISIKLLYVLISRLTVTAVFDPYSLITLKACLRNYTSACGHSGNRIVKRLYQFVDFPCESTRRLAAECFAYLPYMGSVGGGEKQAKQSENWQDQAGFLLNQIHDSLHTLLGVNAETLSCDFLPNPTTATKMTSFPPLDTLDLENMTNRIDFCATCLKFMLIRHLSSSFYVKIPIKSIIDLLRCFLSALNLHKKLRPEVVQVMIESMSVLTETFADLPQILRFTLSPYCAQIFDYIESTLHAISVLLQTPVKNTVKLKCALYRLLGEIGRHVSVCSRIHLVLPKFWTYLKYDLQFSRLNDSILDQKQPYSANKIDFNPEKYKRKRKHKLKEHNEPETDYGDQFIKKPSDPTPKRDIIVRAATTLSAIIATCGSAVKASLYRDVQKLVCKLLLSTISRRGHSANSSSHSNILEPYDIVACLAALLELLRNLTLCRHPECAPAVQGAMQIFQAFSTTNRETKDIVDLCHNAILALNCATKPRVPSLESCIGINEDLKKDTVEANCCDEQEDNDMGKIEPFSFITKPSTELNQKNSTTNLQIQQDIVDSSTTASNSVLNDTSIVQQNDDDDDDICFIQDIVDSSRKFQTSRDIIVENRDVVVENRDIVDSATTESSNGDDLSRRDAQNNDETSSVMEKRVEMERDNDEDTIIVNIDSENSSDDELQEICVFPPPSKRAKISTSASDDFSSDPPTANSSASQFFSNKPDQSETLEKSRDVVESVENPIESIEKPIEDIEKPKSVEIVNIEELLLDFVDAPAD